MTYDKEDIVARDSQLDIVVTWNGSVIFNAYIGDNNVDCMSNFDCKTKRKAISVAKKWLRHQIWLDRWRRGLDRR